MSVIVNFAMFPMDKGVSMSKYVALLLEPLRRSGVEYELGSMGTTFEARDIEEAMEVVAMAHEALAEDSDRIYCTMTIDSRKGDEKRMQHKVDRVIQHTADRDDSSRR